MGKSPRDESQKIVLEECSSTWYNSKKGLCKEYRVHFSMQMKENKMNKVPQGMCIYLTLQVIQKTVKSWKEEQIFPQNIYI